MVVVLCLAVLVVVALAAFSSSPTGPRSPLAPTARLGAAGPPAAEIIAVQGELPIQLPVAQDRLTAVGYHAAGADALPLKPLGRQKNEGLFTRVFHRIFGGGGSGIGWFQLPGGEGPSTGAVDVGAPVGTDVYAPVSGTVVSIRAYVLDGRKYGNVIQIQPDKSPSLVVMATHLSADPALTVGSPLTAGTTRIGQIVDFSSVERQSLADHTQDAGNHVTLETNQAATSALR